MSDFKRCVETVGLISNFVVLCDRFHTHQHKESNLKGSITQLNLQSSVEVMETLLSAHLNVLTFKINPPFL